MLVIVVDNVVVIIRVTVGVGRARHLHAKETAGAGQFEGRLDGSLGCAARLTGWSYLLIVGRGQHSRTEAAPLVVVVTFRVTV